MSLWSVRPQPPAQPVIKAANDQNSFICYSNVILVRFMYKLDRNVSIFAFRLMFIKEILSESTIINVLIKCIKNQIYVN